VSQTPANDRREDDEPDGRRAQTDPSEDAALPTTKGASLTQGDPAERGIHDALVDQREHEGQDRQEAKDVEVVTTTATCVPRQVDVAGIVATLECGNLGLVGGHVHVAVAVTLFTRHQTRSLRECVASMRACAAGERRADCLENASSRVGRDQASRNGRFLAIGDGRICAAIRRTEKSFWGRVSKSNTI